MALGIRARTFSLIIVVLLLDAAGIRDGDLLVSKLLKSNESSLGERRDCLTVMTFNTFLMEVRLLGITFSAKPSLQERADGIVKWFSSLTVKQMPDVLVLQEIFSRAGADVIRKLCSETWQPTARTVVKCDKGKLFEASTGEVCGTSWGNPFKGGGVVVLVKQGLKVHPRPESQCFQDYCGMERLAYKGFWVVKVSTPAPEHRSYVVVGTHTQAYEDEGGMAIRKKQFTQISHYLDANVKDKTRVIFAGDFNVFTNPYKGAPEPWESEGKSLEALLEGQKSKPTPGHFLSGGFWLPTKGFLAEAQDADFFTLNTTRNHFLYHNETEAALNSQKADWILVPGKGSRFSSPEKMRYQYIPMKADSCFTSTMADGKTTDDLSDHYAVFAQICYKDHTEFPDLEGPKGHLGAGGVLPSKLPNCTSPKAGSSH